MEIKISFYLFLVFVISDSKAAWKHLEDHDYYYDETAVVASFREAVVRCKDLNAALVTVKTKNKRFYFVIPWPW